MYKKIEVKEMTKHYKGENGVSMTTFRITKKMRENASDGVYRVSKEEREQIKKRNEEWKEKKEKIKEFDEAIHPTTYALLSKELNTPVNESMIKSCRGFRNLGNGRLAIKYVSGDNQPIIRVKRQKGKTYTFQIVG